MEDFQLVLERARAGDEEAFATLWRATNPALRRFLATLSRHDDAVEVASTVWLEVVKGLDGFAGDEAGFRSWIFTIARRRLIDLHRAQARRPQDPLDEGVMEHAEVATDPAVLVEIALDTNAALALIASLPPDQAEVLLLRVVADLDVDTVAEIVGKRPGTVRVIAHRGLRKLAEQLDAGGSQPDATQDVTR